MPPKPHGGNVEPAGVNTVHTEVYLETEETPNLIRKLLLNLPHVGPRERQHFYFTGQKTKLSPDLERDVISSF